MNETQQRGLDNHIFGMDVEGVFDKKCKDLGINSEKAHPHEAWDRIAGIFRVQIKATKTLSRQNRGRGRYEWAYTVSGCREDAARTHFARDLVDFLAIYVAPQARWYILPANQADCNRIRIAREPVGRMREALERWDRLMLPTETEMVVDF